MFDNEIIEIGENMILKNGILYWNDGRKVTKEELEKIAEENEGRITNEENDDDQ